MTNLKIPFVDLKKINSKYKKKFLTFLSSAIKNSNYIKGKKTEEFERKLCNIFQSKRALTVNSGTDALIVGIKSLNLKKGDEILTTSNTWISSAYAIELNNCKPVFIDVNKDNFQMDIDLFKKKINKKTKAVLITHLYGLPNNMEEICKIAKKYNLIIIEDIAQSHLAKYKSKIVGNFGDVACLSFYPSKNLGALGDGGAILTNSEKIYNKCKSLANYGAKDFRKANHNMIGINSRLDELQAYFLLEKLKKLKSDTSSRQKLAKIYDKKCDELGLQYLPSSKKYQNSYHIYLVVVKNRNSLKKKLFKKGISTKIHYEIPIHLQTAFKHLNYKKGDLPVTEYLSKNILSLPFYPGIEKRKINYLFKSLKELLY
jgi:dTDP-4-amino-4,6-dideoxygalactose transaminase